MSTRTKVGLGFKEYFGENEVFDLSRPSTMYPEPVEQEVNPLYSWFVKAGEMHAVPPSITGTYMPSPYKSDIEKTQVSYGSNDKSSDSATYASCDSSLKTKTKDFPPAVDIQTLPESDVEDPNSTTGSPSFSCSENVKSPRIICNKSGMNNRNVFIPRKSKAANVQLVLGNRAIISYCGGSDPLQVETDQQPNSADRPQSCCKPDSAMLIKIMPGWLVLPLSLGYLLVSPFLLCNKVSALPE
ncbi:hypothetical protein Tco_0530950 [Tanacetum coccineum]